MRKYTGLVGVALGVALMLAATADTASATFDKDQAKCRKTLSKNVNKVLKTAGKVSGGCHKDRNKGKRPDTDDCNDMSVADSKLKLSKAQGKFNSAMVKSCASATIGTVVLDEYISCPEPCNTSTGVGNPLTTYDDLATCLGCVAADVVAQRNVIMVGNPTAPIASKDDQKCHSTIVKGFDKHLQTILKERAKCQDTAEAKAGACGLDDTSCATDDSKGKIAGAAVKAEAGVSGACAATDFSQFALTGSCSGATDPTSYNACATPENSASGDVLLPAAYELEANDVCPLRVDTTIRSGFGVQCTTNADCDAVQTCEVAGPVSRCTTSSKLDVGWTGLAHDVDLTDSYLISADVDCSASTPSTCDSCTIDGVSTASDSYERFSRCELNTSVVCTDPFDVVPGVDPDCLAASAGDCGYYLGPPLPISAALNPTCSLLKYSEDISGTANADTGDSVFSANLLSKVHTGLGQTQPCPTCEGDTVASDDVRDGTCNGGPLDGMPCDIQAFHGTFANADDDEGLSLDCPPPDGANITGNGLVVPIDFTTHTSTLAFETNCDPPFPPPPAFVCACGVCSLATTKPCANNGDCGGGEGDCNTNGGGQAAARQPNACSDLVCTDVGGGFGECTAGGPTDDLLTCDGELRASGEGYLSCANDAECRPFDTLCAGGNCGNCTLSKTRRCFNDPIVMSGFGDTEVPVLAATFCLPPTSNNAINTTTGSPGPGRTKTQTSVVRKFKP